MNERFPRVFHGAGTTVEVGGSHQFSLSGHEGAFQVEEGQIDVFAVRTRNGEAVSRRRHLARFSEGEILFGGPADPSYGLIGVPAGMCRVREITDASLYGLSLQTVGVEFVCSAIDTWVESIAGGIFEQIPPKDHLEPAPGDVLMIEPDRFVRSTGEVVWAVHEEGSSLLFGRAEMLLQGEGGAAYPIGSRLWLQSAEVSRLRFYSTFDRLIDGDLWEDLRAFHSLTLRAFAVAEDGRREVYIAQLARKQRADSTALAHAVSQLATVMSEDASVPEATGDALLAACELVGGASGIQVRPPSDMERAEPRGRLQRIASASRFRTRRVALREEWWRFDAGPLLGLIIDVDSKSRLPVALLRGSGNSYSIVDPRGGEPVPIDARVSGTLDPFAYSFYKPFGDRALAAWDVFKFAAEGCRRDFSTVLLMGLAGGLLGLLTPIITGVIFNSVIPGAERIRLIHMTGALLACAVATALFQLVRGLAVLRIESKMDASVQSAVWDRLLNLPATFFRRFAAGDLAMRAGGISEIRRLLSGATIASLLSGLFSAFNLALLFYYDVRLALWALGLTLIALGVMLAASYAQLRYQREIAAAQSHLSGQVLQYITGITKLRVAGAETKSYERWASAFASQRRLQFAARRIGNALASFNGAFPVLSLMAFFGVMVAQSDLVMATGDFIAFHGAYGSFTANMLSATGAFIAIMMSVPIYEQARPILESLPEVIESKAPPGALSGEIEVSHVSFRYDDHGAPVLDDVSIAARPGEFVALVGPSGSGKSTILRLLLGFEEPESGSIYFDGQDISGLDIQAVRRQIGVVLQNGSMMSGDVFTNITGSSLATMDDAWEAARMAGLDDDIRAMPMGMHTVISEGGTTLSGGQRQRLLIARAIVNRPRLIFFDEATSALDNRTQSIVSHSLERLQATRIVVAHRLSTIINADRIYVLESGRVVQTGTYATLCDEGGLFSDLIRRQMA